MRSPPPPPPPSRTPFTRALFLLPMVLALAAGAARAAEPTPGAPEVRLRRFALMVGVNDGGPTRPRLRYATSDALALGRVLESLGGVAAEDRLLLSEPSRRAVLEAFDRLDRLVAAGAAPGVRREVVIYYSGHSDEDGLLLGKERLSYDELRLRVQAIPADVRLAILDSCASGAFTRRKGGVRRPPFLLDASTSTKGHAFLTSSAVNEVAQESDRIGASFFTHFLVSGLRGAADVNRDRRVTLQEAFQFAAQETLARTERTHGGPQHAAYEFDLVGTSDLVVTDVRSTQATLALASDLAGRISVRGSAGALVVELRKTTGHPVELGLEAGAYVVTMDGGATPFEANVNLAMGQRVELARVAFHPGRPLELARARGDAPAGDAGLIQSGAVAERPLRKVSARAGLLPMPGDQDIEVGGFSFGFLGDRVGRLSSGVQLSLVFTMVDQQMSGTQLSTVFNAVRGPASGAQLSAGFNYAERSFRGAQLTSGGNIVLQEFSGAQLAAGANFAGGEGRGAQLAGGVNVAQAWRGAQLAGGVNVAARAHGLQGSPINIAGEASGLQLGVINTAGGASGLQLGVINVSRRGSGLKLGVINVAAEHDGETFGIINIIGNGLHNVAVYATDAMLSNVALKLGSRRLYTSFIAAYHPGDALTGPGPERYSYGNQRYGFGLGLGYRVPLERGRLTFVDIEASSMGIHRDITSWNEVPMLASARAVLGIRIAGPLTALVGLSGNVAVAWGNRDLDLAPDSLSIVGRSDSTTTRISPGLLLGLQI